MVNQDPSMTPSDKRQVIDTLYYRMIELARGGNAATDLAAKAMATVH